MHLKGRECESDLSTRWFISQMPLTGIGALNSMQVAHVVGQAETPSLEPSPAVCQGVCQQEAGIWSRAAAEGQARCWWTWTP